MMRYLTTAIVLAAIGLAGCQAPPEKIHTFDSDVGLEMKSNDEGMQIGVENGELRIRGKGTDNKWPGEYVYAPVEDLGGAVEAAVDFRLAKWKGPGLILLSLNIEDQGTLMLFVWNDRWSLLKCLLGGHGRQARCHIQTRFLKIEHKLKHNRCFVNVFNDLNDEFSSMRIRLREDRQRVDFYINDFLIDTLYLDEEIERVKHARAGFQTRSTGKEFDIRFDNLAVEVEGP